ncbi:MULTISPECIES: hypothetical protein [unclassified Microbacterium]|uniref:hypothetical protein n=1 Tax=unclassified Microbacterium TaxID=2609290 RepID=UPI0034306E26
MSTSDQNEQGPLTRKQLREIRLTGSTPVITPDEAAEAAASSTTTPAPPAPRPAAPADIPPAPVEITANDGRLTRRQMRERDRAATASVPVVGEDASAEDQAPEEEASGQTPAEEQTPAQGSALVTGIPAFAPPVSQPAPAEDSTPDAPVVDAQRPAADDDSEADQEIVLAPVSAASSVDSVGEVPIAPFVDESREAQEPGEAPADQAQADDDEDPVAAVAALGIEVETPADPEPDDADDVLADVADAEDVDLSEGERPTVNSAFGQGVLADAAPEPQKPFAPSFDELLTVGDSTGSHRAGNTLIFTPGPGEGSLSGPVASTGEILVTGSYELPKGLGSRGHADGTTDGKEVDAVLIDGELPPASSPTPIAASSAISTIKPAGEVIRPPAPEKGNRLMIILAIVAGGLALAVGVAVVIAITTNVF